MKVLKITQDQLPQTDAYYIAEGGEDMLAEAGINMLLDWNPEHRMKLIVEVIEMTEEQWADIPTENKSPEESK